MDILLDESTHDAVFVNGKTPITSGVSDSLKQRLKIKLLTFRGEWFLNVNYGTPYFQQIFGKGRSKRAIDLIFRQLIQEDEDVLNITEFNSTLSPNRTYSLNFTVQSRTGETLQIEGLEVSV
ncbi:MAG: putative baseplate wedge protein [Prokaryotic dsDNA virus sp.]|jgi:hypothetical protein|nr:MAG: putative baseplate wedge protein [Prokaryotic dsDNA virus sp.]|tara:strand:- start:81409 stop:81774 length:366 start_codon:yes stop_codon:yes gene_type:complete